MKDHEITALVNQARDIAKEYGQTEQLRERLAQLLVPVLKGMPSPEPYSGATFDLAFRAAAQACDEMEAAARAGAETPATALDGAVLIGMATGAKACAMAIRSIRPKL